MIYLIGGPPRCGKTTLTKKLAAQLGIGWVSADILESVVREYVPNELHKESFPKTVLRQMTHGSNDEMYKTFSAEIIVEAYIRQGMTCWKAIETFAEDCLKEAHDFIIEGHQLHPELVARLIQKFPTEIRSAFLIKKDEQLLVEGFQKNVAKTDWVLQKTKEKETFFLIAKMLSHFGERIEKEANKYGLPVYCMDRDFVEKIDEVKECLMGVRNVVS